MPSLATQFPFEIPIWTVSDLTTYLRDLLESDLLLQDLWVQGEISNLSRPSSGHIYFTLKDRESSLRCVMWRSSAMRLNMELQDGIAIEAHGKISIYPTAGQYQLYTDTLRPLGEGALFQEFLRLKSMLETEGLFDPARKRPLPPKPRRLGIVTSPTGAAIRDILHTLQRRYPLVEVILVPTPVQGSEAPPAIVAALQILNHEFQPDVILIARGGGSIEDLWAFNDERVARAIAASRAPVISGVGHETDFTITDFVSDYRAPTPTAAAEIAVPDKANLQQDLLSISQSLIELVNIVLNGDRNSLELSLSRLRAYSPAAFVRSHRQRMDDLEHRLAASCEHVLQLKHLHLVGSNEHLRALSPLATIARGYAVVSQSDGHLVRSINQVDTGDEVEVRVNDGEFSTRVIQVKGESS